LSSNDEAPLFCDRCVRELTPGQGDFYVVKIEAIADPTPPVFQDRDLERDLRGEINKLVAELEDLSERESMDQVCRRVTIFLCGDCYRKWIENPAG
jgi:hypothetical protein